MPPQVLAGIGAFIAIAFVFVVICACIVIVRAAFRPRSKRR